MYSTSHYFGWKATSFAAFGTFMGARWARAAPVYYASGAGGTVYYEDTTVYVNGQASGTAEQFAKTVLALVSAAPAADKVKETEWLSLGVFAFTREGVADSQGMIELAINKQGVLAGTYYNEETGVSRPLKGTLDDKSQRVAVGFADGKNANVALETGVDNLTRDEAPGLLHFGTIESEAVLLVRLKSPAEDTAGRDRPCRRHRAGRTVGAFLVDKKLMARSAPGGAHFPTLRTRASTWRQKRKARPRPSPGGPSPCSRSSRPSPSKAM